MREKRGRVLARLRGLARSGSSNKKIAGSVAAAHEDEQVITGEGDELVKQRLDDRVPSGSGPAREVLMSPKRDLVFVQHEYGSMEFLGGCGPVQAWLPWNGDEVIGVVAYPIPGPADLPVEDVAVGDDPGRGAALRDHDVFPDVASRSQRACGRLARCADLHQNRTPLRRCIGRAT